MTNIRKRFIAGAVCPRCHRQDTLAVGRDEAGELMLCVQCGYQQRHGDEPRQATSQPGDVIGMFQPD